VSSVFLPTIGDELGWEIDAELLSSHQHEKKFHSAHEAYGVILEELDEVWEIVKLKRRDRSPSKLRKELIQLAAMAIKGIQSIENMTGGSV